MKIGSLFTGYGGLDGAAEEILSARTVWTSDIDPGACKIIARRYPNVPNHGDITAINWTQVEPVDILTGGWPCQPFSQAGKRKGIKDERALWPEVIRAIRTLRPRYVFLENVAAIATSGTGPELARAAAGLAEVGYVGSWRCLRASDVGAPHGRPRIFLLATDADGQTGGFDRPRLVTPGSPATPLRQEGEGATGRSRGTHPLLPTPRAQNGTDRNSRIWERPLDQPQNLENALARPFAQYAAAVARWQQIVGRTAPDPTITGRLSPLFVEWMMGLPAGWVTDVPDLTRSQQLKALGNGVVPQQAYAALHHMLTAAEVAA